MMQQASFEFGFEADDIPLMIEAIPLSSECIVLIITKVEGPKELDTRFSKFAPSVHEDADAADTAEALAESADDVLDLFRRVQGKQSDTAGEKSSSDTGTKEPLQDTSSKIRSIKEALQKKLAENSSMELTRLYLFHSLDEVLRLSHVLSGCYHGENSLYRQEDGTYILVLSKNGHTPVEFNKICNILSEYSSAAKSVPASESYLEEHYEPVIKNDALQSLSCM